MIRHVLCVVMITMGCFWSSAAFGAAGVAPGCEQPASPTSEATNDLRVTVDRDLAVFRELAGRRSRSEISEHERQTLWQAYVSRTARGACHERETPVKRPAASAKPLVFVGPGF